LRHRSVGRQIAGLGARLLALAALLLGVRASAAQDVDPVLAQMGAPYFERLCASCHGVAATGHGSAGKRLRTPPADLTRIAARRGGVFPAGEIAKFIDGRFDPQAGNARVMPIWGARLGEGVPEAGVGESLARGKIAVLIEYLKSIQMRDAAIGGGR